MSARKLPRPGPGPRYLSLAEAADLLGVHPVTVRRWISQGDLPGYRLGQRVRVLQADAEALIHRIPTAAS
jgi:excisionase family DNA binding protein